MSYFSKIKNWAKAHKVISGIIIIVVIYFGYRQYQARASGSGVTRYVMAAVQKSTIISSVSASGQVSASNQIDIKPKASGDVIYVPTVDGQTVSQGQLIAELDTKDAEKAVRDAEVNLESAQLSLQKLTEPADTLSLTQAEDTLAQAQTDLTKSYDDGFTAVANAFLDLPGVMTGLDDVLHGTELSRGTQNNTSAVSDLVKNYYNTVGSTDISSFANDAETKYQVAKASYDKNYADYKTSSRTSSNDTVVSLIKETYDTTKTISDAVKSANDFLNYAKDQLINQRQNIPPIITSSQTALSTYTTETNSHLVDLLNITNTITTSNYAITEKTESLKKLQNGPDTLDVSSQQLSVTLRQNALQDAKDNLADYYIRAPFAGTLAKVDVKVGDSASQGTAVATIISPEKIADVSLNEVDVAKIKTGEKVTLTFDAVPDLTIAGLVAEIDTVGTQSQGVVTYNVKISFDTQDERVKAGMSVTANIITDVKQDVLVVPNSAIKTSGTTSYIETFDTIPAGAATTQGGITSSAPIKDVQVEVGISNDTSSEITSGLNEGDVIVTRTVAPSTTATAPSAPSLFGGGGNRGGAGGAVRFGGGGATGR